MEYPKIEVTMQEVFDACPYIHDMIAEVRRNLKQYTDDGGVSELTETGQLQHGHVVDILGDHSTNLQPLIDKWMPEILVGKQGNPYYFHVVGLILAAMAETLGYPEPKPDPGAYGYKVKFVSGATGDGTPWMNISKAELSNILKMWKE